MSRPDPDLLAFDFEERPFTIAWELTRSCALACRHCRANAQPRRHPRELTTAEIRRGLRQIRDLAPAVLVLTGGDPMMRPDLFEIVAEAAQLDLRVAVSPTATALPTRARLRRLQDLGVHMIHVSLDGAAAATHDAFRGFSGAFDRSLGLLADCQALGLPVQVGTTVTVRNRSELPRMVDLLAHHGVRVWNAFFLVPTGRARREDGISVDEAEQTWTWLVDLSASAPFGVRTTAAPQFRRVMAERRRLPGDGARSFPPFRLTGAGYALHAAPDGVRTRGVNDAKGFLFIDHLGNLCPSGFLQQPAGNLRTEDLAAVYRSAPLFRQLRDPNALTGRCGRCPYADLCGGSRARAFALTGDYLASDPLCGFDVDAARAGQARLAAVPAPV